MFSRYLPCWNICHSEFLMFAGHLSCWIVLFFYCKPNVWVYDVFKSSAILCFWCSIHLPFWVVSFWSICHFEFLMFAGHLSSWVFWFFYCKPNAALSLWCFQVICHSNLFSKPSLILSFDLFKSFTVLNLWFGEIICHAVQYILFFFKSSVILSHSINVACGNDPGILKVFDCYFIPASCASGPTIHVLFQGGQGGKRQEVSYFSGVCYFLSSVYYNTSTSAGQRVAPTLESMAGWPMNEGLPF